MCYQNEYSFFFIKTKVTKMDIEIKLKISIKNYYKVAIVQYIIF